MARLFNYLRKPTSSLAIASLLIASISFVITSNLLQSTPQKLALGINSQKISGAIDPKILAGVNLSQVSVLIGGSKEGINHDGSFSIGGSMGASGLISIMGPKNEILALAFLPKPEKTSVKEVQISFFSTAMGLISTFPGVMTGRPDVDLLIMVAIARSPDFSNLVQRISQLHQEFGSLYLSKGEQTILSAVTAISENLGPSLDQFAEDINSKVFKLQPTPSGQTATASPAVYLHRSRVANARVSLNKLGALHEENVATSQRGEVSCDGPGLAAVNHLEDDQICLAITDQFGSQPEVLRLRALNRAIRWAFLVDEKDQAVGILPPKLWIATSAIQVLRTVADALAGSTSLNATKQLFAAFSQFLQIQYTYEASNETFVVSLRTRLVQYEHPSSTAIDFSPGQARTLSTVAWSSSRRSAPNSDIYEYSSLLLTTLTVIVQPLIEIFLDISPSTSETGKANSKKPSASSSGGNSSKQQKKSLQLTDSLASGERYCLVDQTKKFIESMTRSKGNDVFADFINEPTPTSKSLIKIARAAVSHLASDPQFLLCAFGDPMWQAAKDGRFGKKLKVATSNLAKLKIASLSDLITEIGSPRPGSDVKQYIEDWLALLGVAITDTLVKKALLLLPGADLFVALANINKYSRTGGQIFSLTASVVDAMQGFSTLADIAQYSISGSEAIPDELSSYPQELLPDGTINVGFPISRVGVLRSLTSTINGVKVSGFWVSGTNQLAAFYPNGSLAYSATLELPSGVQNSRLVIKDFRSTEGATKVPKELDFSDPNLPNEDSEILQSGSLDSFFISSKNTPRQLLILSLPRIDSGKAISLLYSYHYDGLCFLSCGGGWVSFDNFLFNPSTSVIVNFDSGATAQVDGIADFHMDVNFKESTVLLGGAQFQEIDGTTGLFSAPKPLPVEPISNFNGLPIGFCAFNNVRSLTYPSADGQITSIDDNGNILWAAKVNPQNTFSSAQSTYTALLENACEILASDSRGTITKFSANGTLAWSSRFSYYSNVSDQSSGDSFNINGVTFAANVAVAISNEDPRILGFSLLDGRSLWRYSLPEPTFKVERIASDEIFVAGLSGSISLLKIPTAP